MGYQEDKITELHYKVGDLDQKLNKAYETIEGLAEVITRQKEKIKELEEKINANSTVSG